ncbi:unnamed protein product [Linum trigynum]|uniref:KIB1-4 beta-propeller domain-containing protein n=1 Tax=Linum trigynum TaxID=586398 RepID=A0AAV2GSX6_9ROSI
MSDWESTAEFDDGVHKDVKYPFLLHYSKTMETNSSAPFNCCRAYSPAYNKTYHLRAPDEVSNACISCSGYGWLLFSGVCRIFFYHPSTGDIIHLPYYHRNVWGSFNRMSFSAPPTSPDCVVIGQVDIGSEKRTRIVFIQRGQSYWNHDENVPNMMRLKNYSLKKLRAYHANSIKITSEFCRMNLAKFRCRGNFFWPRYNSSPLFHKGAFYCLADDGKLGVFNHKAKNKGKVWRVFDTSAVDLFLDNPENEAYLVDCNGELVAVVVGPVGKFVRILKFYEPARVWQIVHDLGDHMILLSPVGCVAKKCDEACLQGLENTLHFSRFHERSHVFYSLSTRQFHSLHDDDYTSVDLYDTMLPLVHAWMTPPHSPFPRGAKMDWSRKLKQRRPIDRNVGPKSRMIIRDLSFVQPPSESYSILPHLEAPTGRPCLGLGSRDNNGEVVLINLAKGMMVDRSRSMAQLALRLRSKIVFSSQLDHGLLVLVDTEARFCSLLYPSSMTEIPLPTWETSFTCESAVVHVPPGNSELAVMVFGRIDDEDGQVQGKGNDVAMVWRDGDEKWTVHTRPSELGVDALRCEVQLVVHQGQIYGYQGYDDDLAVVELRKGGIVVENTQVKGPRFLSPGFVGYSQRLVESCGELLHIVRYHAGECLSVEDRTTVIDMKVFKMDFEAMEWRMLEHLGDRAFLWSERGCYSCCASKSGLQSNSVYFIANNDRGLCVYDYGNRTVSVTLPGPEMDDGWMATGFIMLYD